ncbi:CxxH/CxxC protein [Bacillaceae bacterium S4-13-58]
MNLYVCNDHVELALDKIVDEYETFPTLEKVDNSSSLSTTCEYCGNKPTYIVANTYSSTK